MTKKTHSESVHSLPPSYEEALAELDSIVGQMEAGQLPLEQSLAAYKRGAELLQICQKLLADVEQQVHILNANQLEPYIDSED